MNTCCPRCQGKLYPTIDHDYGWCQAHGDVYIGPPPTDRPVSTRGHLLPEVIGKSKLHRKRSEKPKKPRKSRYW